jgi:hypothetical protein
LVSASFDFAQGAETEFSLAAELGLAAPVWSAEALSADDFEHSLGGESTGGTLAGSAESLAVVSSGTANSRSDRPRGAADCAPNRGSLGVAGAGARLLFGCDGTVVGTIVARLSIWNCAIEAPALTVINTSHGPTLPAEGTMEARPSWVVTSCVSDDPRRMGIPFWPELTRASVVAKATVTPITGFAALEPSVTRTTRG